MGSAVEGEHTVNSKIPVGSNVSSRPNFIEYSTYEAQRN